MERRTEGIEQREKQKHETEGRVKIVEHGKNQQHRAVGRTNSVEQWEEPKVYNSEKKSMKQ